MSNSALCPKKQNQICILKILLKEHRKRDQNQMPRVKYFTMNPL
jgi:hypothetical protein